MSRKENKRARKSDAEQAGLERPRYEDCLDVINNEINKRYGRWRLPHLMEFADVAQTLRLHIWKKWHLYNPKYPLANWLSRIISNQLKNLLRNLTTGTGRPCEGCIYNQPGDGCAKYEVKSHHCGLYARWLHKTHKSISIVSPIAGDEHFAHLEDNYVSMDWDKHIQALHPKIMSILRPRQQQVYELCYIRNLSNEEAAEMMGYKRGRLKLGVTYVQSLKKQIRMRVVEALRKGIISID